MRGRLIKFLDQSEQRNRLCISDEIIKSEYDGMMWLKE